MREYEKILKALANNRRLAIVKYLKSNKEATVGEIAEHIKLSLKATSKHLAVLFAAGILDKEQRSLMVFYAMESKQSDLARVIINIL